MIESRMIQYEGDLESANSLFYAALLGLEEVVKKLVGHQGVDVNTVDESDINKASSEGRTPFYVAASRGDIGTVKLLLEKGADLTIATNDGWTPLNSASAGGYIDVAKLLLEKGADLTVANNGGRTSLYTACFNGHIEVVKLLLKKGADLTIADQDGWTPLDLASSRGHIEVVHTATGASIYRSTLCMVPLEIRQCYL